MTLWSCPTLRIRQQGIRFLPQLIIPWPSLAANDASIAITSTSDAYGTAAVWTQTGTAFPLLSLRPIVPAISLSGRY